MAQILEVIIAMVISAMMASTITALALSPINTQRQKNNYAAAESMAITVRRFVAQSDKTAFPNDASILDVNKYVSLKDSNNNKIVNNNYVNGEGCVIRDNYSPPSNAVVVPYAAVCIQGTSKDKGQAWQPLYTVNNFSEQIGAGTGSIAIQQCLTDISAAKTVFNTAPTSPTTLSDLSAYNGCKNVASSITLTTSGWSNSNKYLCDINIFVDGNNVTDPAKTYFKGAFKGPNC